MDPMTATRRQRFKVVRSWHKPGLGGLLTAVDDYVLTFHLARPWYWLRLKSIRLRYRLRLVWIRLSWPVDAWKMLSQVVPAARRIAAREGLPVHQVLNGCSQQSKFLAELGVTVDPVSLIGLYERGRSIAEVNGVLRRLATTESLESMKSTIERVFDVSDLVVTHHPAKEVR